MCSVHGEIPANEIHEDCEGYFHLVHWDDVNKRVVSTTCRSVTWHPDATLPKSGIVDLPDYCGKYPASPPAQDIAAQNVGSPAEVPANSVGENVGTTANPSGSPDAAGTESVQELRAEIATLKTDLAAAQERIERYEEMERRLKDTRSEWDTWPHMYTTIDYILAPLGDSGEEGDND